MPGNGTNGEDGGPTTQLRQQIADALDALAKMSNMQGEHVAKVTTFVVSMMEDVIGQLDLLHQRIEALEVERRHEPGRDEGGAGAALN